MLILLLHCVLFDLLLLLLLEKCNNYYYNYNVIDPKPGCKT